MSHFYEDDNGERRECPDEGHMCLECETSEIALFAAHFGLTKGPNPNARFLSGSKDEAERVEAECKEAGRT